MKTLVVYYSRSGHTARIAEEIASHCKADIERIKDAGAERGGLWGYLRSACQAAIGAKPPIKKPSKNPADYELVVIGTPVWNWGLAAPVRSYASQYAQQFKQVAFFCTEGGSGEQGAFDELQRICGKSPLVTLAVKEGELEPLQHAQPLRRFAMRLSG
ncbi:flavodoxin family protein [Paucibacter soli]|uniref:flavodoxin family protein n=1 Tax=Paucibacter soli TaxID=3133433 RepID=UPI0030973073